MLSADAVSSVTVHRAGGDQSRARDICGVRDAGCSLRWNCEPAEFSGKRDHVHFLIAHPPVLHTGVRDRQPG